jgi:hypothetical protein
MCDYEFKVGDKVRRVEPTDYPRDGFGVLGGVYTVLAVSAAGIQVTEDCPYAMTSAFELVEEAEPKGKPTFYSNELYKVETPYDVYYLDEAQFHTLLCTLTRMVEK